MPDGLPPPILPNNHEPHVWQVLRPFIDQHVEAHTKLLTDYAKIRDRAQASEPISAADFTEIEKRAADEIEQLDRQLNKAIIDHLTRDPNSSNVLYGVEKRQIDQGKFGFYECVIMRTNEWLEAHPDVRSALTDTTVIDRTFVRQYVQNAPKENTDIPIEPSTTEKEFLQDLLAHNNGFVVGEDHEQIEARQMMATHMQTLYDSGVRAIYIEHAYQLHNTLFHGSLEDIIKGRETIEKDLRDRPSPPNRGLDGSLADPDVALGFYDLVIAAKKAGVRVVPIDKEGRSRDIEAGYSIPHRISSTNYTWLETIKADMEKHPNEKVVVFGGLLHFSQSYCDPTQQGHPVFPVHGLVDEALGLPLLDFANRSKTSEPYVTRGTNPNGADFMLSGGEDYGNKRETIPASEKPIEKLLVDDAPDGIAPPPNTPIPAARNAIRSGLPK